MTTPAPRPNAAMLSQRAPVDSSWPDQHIEPYRAELLRLLDAAERRMDDATQRHDAMIESSRVELDELQAKIPDVGENPSEVEWLARRAAQADRDLAAAQHEAKAQELWLERQRMNLEVHELSWRVAQLDDLLESGVYASGNAAQTAVIMLDVQEAASDLTHNLGILEIARQRVPHVKRMHREINTALRKARLSAESARKR